MSNGYAGAVQAAPPPNKPNILEGHLNGLDSIIDNLARAVDRARSVADYLVGSEPQTGLAQEALKSPAESMARKLEVTAVRLSDLASQLHIQLARFERL